MKKLFILAGFILFVGGFKPAFADMPTNVQGYTAYQYEVITTTGINNITWSRQVQRIDIVQKSTHTCYVHPFDILTSSDAVTHTAAAQSVDRVTGTTLPYILLDSNTADQDSIYYLKSNDFCIYVSTDNCPATPNIRIWGYGW